MRLTFTLLLALCANAQVTINWPQNKLENFPSRLEPPANVQVTVKDVNDYLYSYRGSITVDPTAQTSLDMAEVRQMFASLSSEQPDACKVINDTNIAIRKALDDHFVLKKKDGKYPSVPMVDSQLAWRTKLKNRYDLMELADSRQKECPGWKTYASESRSMMQKLARADDGKHEYPFTRTIPENGEVTVTVQEYYDNELTSDGEKSFVFSAQSGRFFLSVGYLSTQVQARSYDIVDVGVLKGTAEKPATATTPAVPAVPDKTLKELRVQGDGKYRPAMAVLLNYKLPIPSLLGSKWGVALSAGPVYRVATNGGNTSASNWGIFAGTSVHLWERLWITPGLHLGEFSDFPLGLRPGVEIPNGYPSSFSGVNRWTTRFGVGITFRAADFKSASSVIAKAAPGSAGAGGAGGGTASGLSPAPAKPAAAAAPAAAPSVSNPNASADANDISKKIQDLRQKITAAEKADKDADAVVFEKQKTLKAALAAKTAKDAESSAKTGTAEQMAGQEKDASGKFADATKKLTDAGPANRPAAKIEFDKAQKDLQQASEASGKAKAEAAFADASAKAAQLLFDAANKDSIDAIKKKADAAKTLNALKTDLDTICAAIGGCKS